MYLAALRALRVAHRVLGRALPAGAFALRFPGVPGRIHADDLMLRSPAPDAVHHYVTDAESAMANLAETLAATGRSFGDVAACLDFPSGYGRVTRHLVRRIGVSRVTVGDIDREAVRFCVSEFGVTGFVAAPPARIPGTYDLVFVGSLLTHLPPSTCVDVLYPLAVALRPAGLIVFTTQGESCLEHLDWYGAHFAGHAAAFRSSVLSSGAGFVAYPRRADYGIAILTRRWVEATMSHAVGHLLRPVRFAERGWDAHQDVWSFQRVA